MRYTRDNLMPPDLKTLLLFEGLDFPFTHVAIDVYRVAIDAGGFVTHFVPDPTHLQLVYFLYNHTPKESDNVDNPDDLCGIEWDIDDEHKPKLGEQVKYCKRVKEETIIMNKKNATNLLKICRTLVWTAAEISGD